MSMSTNRQPSPAVVGGASCRVGHGGEVLCDFGSQQQPDQAPGLPPGCVVDLDKGTWSCPGHAIHGKSADVKRTFTDGSGHRWAATGPDAVVVPATRSVSVGSTQTYIGASRQSPHETPANSRRGGSRSDNMSQQLIPHRPTSVGQLQGFGGNPIPNAMVAPGQRGAMVQPGQQLVHCDVPLMAQFTVDNAGNLYAFGSRWGDPSIGNTLNIYPPNGKFHIAGLKTTIGPDLVYLLKLTAGDSDSNMIASGEVDLYAWNTDECWSFFPNLCASTIAPIKMMLRAQNADPSVFTDVTMFFYGRHDQAAYACGPAL